MASSFVFDIDVINEKGKEKRQLGISDVIYYEEKKKKKKRRDRAYCICTTSLGVLYHLKCKTS